MWRRVSEKFYPDCTVARKHTGKTVMFWGNITFDNIGILLKCSNALNAKNYIEIIEQAAISTATLPIGLSYMKDNAPIHRVRLDKDWLKLHGIDVLEWPPHSPYINLIANVWLHIKETLNRVSPKSSYLAEQETNV